MFTVLNLYEVGQEVFVVEKKNGIIEKTETCDICLGEGYFNYKGHPHRCAKCSGKGKIILDTERVTRYQVSDNPKKITSIRYMVYGKENISEPQLKYKVDGKFIEEQLLYPTYDEAENACDQLNNPIDDKVIDSLNV